MILRCGSGPIGPGRLDSVAMPLGSVMFAGFVGAMALVAVVSRLNGGEPGLRGRSYGERAGQDT